MVKDDILTRKTPQDGERTPTVFIRRRMHMTTASAFGERDTKLGCLRGRRGDDAFTRTFANDEGGQAETA
jgi:hypothetical protein